MGRRDGRGKRDHPLSHKTVRRSDLNGFHSPPSAPSSIPPSVPPWTPLSPTVTCSCRRSAPGCFRSTCSRKL